MDLLMKGNVLLCLLVWLSFAGYTYSWVSPIHYVSKTTSSRQYHRGPLFGQEGSEDSWDDLTTDGGVRKRIVSTSEADPYSDGTVATISYKGTLAASDWTAEEINRCWLAEQQGYKDDTELQANFIENNIDEATLTNLESFTESFVQDTLGITAKIQCKKLIMAAKRLATTRSEFPVGTEFDSQDNYEVIIGPDGKVISGMKLGIAKMAPGETALLRIRSDYGYGGEGYRKRNGDVMVPPFATLEFEITLT